MFTLIILLAHIATTIVMPAQVICADFVDFPQPTLLGYLEDNSFPDAWLGYPDPDEEAQWGIQHGFLNDTDPNAKVTILFITASTRAGKLGAIQLMIDWAHPQDTWLFVYADLEMHTAADGRWYSAHPCSASYLNWDQAVDVWLLGKGQEL